MEKLTITRWYNEDCTVGRLCFGSFQCFTLELPLLSNEQNMSCIYPALGYIGRKHFSPKNGDVIAIDNVLGRTGIQVHTGNYTRQIKGCILVGDSVRFLDKDATPDVTNSKRTLESLLKILPDEFIISIK